MDKTRIDTVIPLEARIFLSFQNDAWYGCASPLLDWRDASKQRRYLICNNMVRTGLLEKRRHQYFFPGGDRRTVQYRITPYGRIQQQLIMQAHEWNSLSAGYSSSNGASIWVT